MHKVFIVDDEEFVVKSLIGSIQWEALGFEIAGKASNGREALEYIRNEEVDIVFSDIRMPGINGLELIKEVKKESPEIIFIMISGYPEFSYVQKALHYGALGYCLKPFDETEISELLMKAKSIINARYMASSDDFFNFADLIYNNDKKDELRLKLQERGLHCDNKNSLSLLSIISSHYPELQGLQPYVSFKAGVNKYYFIVPSKNINGQYFADFLEMQNNLDIVGVGISEPFFSLDRMQDAIEEANFLSLQYFMNGKRVCSCKIKENFIKGDEFLNRILREYIRGNHLFERIQPEIYKLLEKDCLSIKHAFMIYHFNTCLANSGEIQYLDNIYSFDELTKNFKDFKSLLKSLSEAPNSERTIKEGKTINFQQVLNYINKYFTENISIQDIAERYYINPSYFSQLFRKEMGMTFTDYIANKRMELAKALLQDDSNKLIEISQKCGYNDYFYFIRSFKKYTGISPGQYRSL